MAARRNDLLSALSAVDAAVVALDRVVRQGTDPVDPEAIRAELGAFVSAVDEVRRMLATEQAEEAPASEPAARGDARDDEDRGRDFSEFFATVAESVIDAQKELDLKSTEYIQYQNELARRSKGFRPLPSFFRIPRVSADFKFAIEAQKSRRVGLIFFSDTQRASSRHQQSIQFEIASVPPSPELIEQLRRGEPQLDLVLSPGTRQRVFEAIERTTPQTNVAEREKQMLLDADNRDGVLMLATEQGRAYFLLHADESELKLLGVWQLVLDPGETPRLDPVYKFNRAPAQGEELALLKKLLLDLALQQRTFLGQFVE